MIWPIHLLFPFHPLNLKHKQSIQCGSYKMSQIIRLRRWSVHVPSVARARILPTLYLQRPQIYIEGHNGRIMEINYRLGEWGKAQQDFVNLQQSMVRCQKALESVPIVDQNQVVENPAFK